MKDDNTEYVACPMCKSTVKVDVRWAKKNGRIFCNTCGKAFDISIEEDDEPPKKSSKDDYDYWNS